MSTDPRLTNPRDHHPATNPSATPAPIGGSR